MPDIAKCTNDKCPIKLSCYRFTCEPSEYNQSYNYFWLYASDSKNGFECGYYIKNKLKE